MYYWVHGALGYVLVLLKAKLDAPVQLVYKGVLLFVFNCGEEKCVTKINVTCRVNQTEINILCGI